MFRFNGFYLISALLLFLIEVLIGAYAHDAIIRPYGGDFLVVILIYCFIRSFLNVSLKIAAMSALLFAYLVEFSQYEHLVVALGLKDSRIANLLLGNSFSWGDMLCYTLGILLVMAVKKTLIGKTLTRNNF